MIISCLIKPDTTKALDYLKSLKPDQRRAETMETSGTMYGTRYSKVHAALLSAANEANYADMYLLDEAGRVVFSLNKGVELGKYMAAPELNGSPLAKLFTELKATEVGKIAFIDYSAFAPVGPAPSAFIGVPMARKSNVAMDKTQTLERSGYFIIRLDPSTFNRVLSDRSGLEEAEQTLAIGEDGVIRSDMALATGPTAGALAKSQGYDPNALDAGWFKIERNGTPILAAKADVKIFNAHWRVLAEDTEAEAMADANATMRTLALTAGVIGLVTVAIGIFSAMSITKPIERLTKTLDRLANGEQVDVIAGRNRKDEIGRIARATDLIRERSAIQAMERAQEQEAERMTREAQRREEAAQLAREFEARVGSIVENVAKSAVHLETSATHMQKVAKRSSDQSGAVASAATSASVDVQMVASASEGAVYLDQRNLAADRSFRQDRERSRQPCGLDRNYRHLFG